MWVYILAFNFVPLIYTCVFLSILCFFLIVMALYYTLKLWCVTFRFLLFSQDCFVFSESFVELYRRQWHPTPVFLPGESHGRRSLEGCSPWDRCGLDTTEQLTHTCLEYVSLDSISQKAMAPHSSILAWRIPWTEEPSGPQSMGLQRARHD